MEEHVSCKIAISMYFVEDGEWSIGLSWICYVQKFHLFSFSLRF